MSAVLRENANADSVTVRLSPGGGSFSPIQLPLLGPILGQWQIVQPLLISIERGDDVFLVSDDLFALYGQGDDIAEALEDYLASLTEYYELLSLHHDEPSVALFNRLSSYLQPV